MNDIIKITKSLENPGLLIEGATETVKHEGKIRNGLFDALIAPMSASMIAVMTTSLIHPVVSSLINVISAKGVMKAGKKQEGVFLPLLVLLLMMKVLEKVQQGLEKDITTWIVWTRIFSSDPVFKQYQDY